MLMMECPLAIHAVSKGLSTYDYIVLHRESEEDTRNEGGLERGFHGRCAFLRRKVASWSLLLSLAIPSEENDLAQQPYTEQLV